MFRLIINILNNMHMNIVSKILHSLNIILRYPKIQKRRFHAVTKNKKLRSPNLQHTSSRKLQQIPHQFSKSPAPEFPAHLQTHLRRSSSPNSRNLNLQCLTLHFKQTSNAPISQNMLNFRPNTNYLFATILTIHLL